MMPAIKGFQLVLMTFAVSMGIFMNVLDVSIANVAIPTMAGNLGVSADEGTWVITSFSVSMAIILPLTGWLGRRFGEVRLFVISTLLFTLASVLCGMSSSLTMLILFRTLQGAFAGPMIPLSQSILLSNYPAEKKSLATALWATVAVAAPVVGPILGGYITDEYKWPWIFYINIPIGLFSAFFTWSILKNRETPKIKQRVDFVGLLLLTICVGSLQILLDKGKDADWFHSSFIITLTIVSLISFCFLLVWELTEKDPIIDLSLFARRNFTIGTSSISLGYMAYLGGIVILPLWLQTQMNYTPTWAGLVTAPLGILPLILSPFLAKLMNKIDLRLLVSFGFLVFVYCAFDISTFSTNTTAHDVAVIRFIQGIGVPFFFIPTISIILSGLPDKDIASAAGLSNFIRILAGSFGTSISVTLWSNRESIHQSKLVENLTSYNVHIQDFVTHLQSLGLTNKASYAVILKTIINQAYVLAINDVFYSFAIINLILMGFIWLAVPPFLVKSSNQGAH